ncbi:hypothetical protein BRE01_63000 [Brevibacillus reuszeri]|uniref:HTH cro/C1-type domain-containing protein n=1 Tax=Brevibacillus reuszeri TaxID=54915 RepID=A0A0K9YXK2_9BACL|nr:helix-turn-helix transcriptional regulator [Brevibacillus reuszeri]KNB72975.1 hypothetical protein ADS79_14245 [Brevibacillus reuszeri]GED72598.1 hypothetical protein BRE01_63000 [Brevibacillus reuszeri]
MLRLMIPSNFDYCSANLRDKIQYWLHKQNWKHSHLALATGIQKSAISYLMNGERKFTVEQLDKVTQALGFEKGEFYSDFGYELLDEKTGQYKLAKCSTFIKEIAVLGKFDILNRLTNNLLECSPKYVKVLFDSAEELYEKKEYKAAEPLYKTTSTEVRNRQDYKLSLSIYKQFMIARKSMLEDNDGVKTCKDLMLKLTDYLELLPIEDKLEAYIEVIVFYNLIEDYQNTLRYAERLISLIEDLLIDIERNKLNKTIIKEYENEARMYKGFAFKGLEKYQESLNEIQKYSSFNDNYQRFAIGNECLVKLLMGEWCNSNKYLDNSMNEKKRSILLPVILEAGIKHSNYDEITRYLSNNEGILDQIEHDNTSIGLKHKLITYQYIAVYYLNTGHDEQGINYLLKSMKLACHFQNEIRFKKCWLLFTNNSHLATQEQKELFNHIVETNI